MTPPASTAPELTITTREVGGAAVIEVHGEIDLVTAPDLLAALSDGLARAGRRPCVLDLSVVTYLGSPGLTALLDATELARSHQQPLPIVVDANRPVIRPITVTGLDQLLALYHTVEEALGRR
jgi:anti-sigma B factor antagonist